jgi:hypothetical protein
MVLFHGYCFSVINNSEYYYIGGLKEGKE